jgi:pSer/pThr/pTyr-binding forkhead associated (FHA) protein
MTPTVTLTVKGATNAGRTYELCGLEDYVVGRAADCAIGLAGDSSAGTVSRHHCLLRVDADGVWVRDLGSCNGTLLNGMQIGRPMSWYLPPSVRAAPCREYALHDTDELRVGNTVFTVSITRPAEEWSPWEVETAEGEELFAACAGCGHGLACQALRDSA